MPTSPGIQGDGFEVPVDFVLPDFTDIDLVDSVETATETVEETYYDTASKHLDRSGLALRRSKASSGAQWQLAIPAAETATIPRIAAISS